MPKISSERSEDFIAPRAISLKSPPRVLKNTENCAIINPKGGGDMKNVNVIQLIASLCLLFGSIINLLNICIEIPLALSVCSVPLLLASIILYLIFWKKQIKDKKQDKNDTN